MHTAANFLDDLKAAHSLTSDYSISKLLDREPSAISNWRAGRKYPSENDCFKIAEKLDLNGAAVFACIKAQKSTCNIMRKDWLEIAEKFGIAA